MSLSYSLIIPHYRTLAITRIALHALQTFSTGNAEILLIANDPTPEDLALSTEFPTARFLPLPSTLNRDAANLDAIDVGLAAASHDLVGIIHSDTIFLKTGWDQELFGRMEQNGLDALSTMAREANAFRPWRKQIKDLWWDLWHQRRPSPDKQGKLMLHFLLTRKSTLAEMGFHFLNQGNIRVEHYTRAGRTIELLSLREGNRYMWHISNTSSLLSGLMNDPKLWQDFQKKWQIFWESPDVIRHFGGFKNPVAGLSQPRPSDL